MVIARSACGGSVSVSVALLLPGVGSVTPTGAVIVAVLLSVPVALAEMFALTVKVNDPPDGRLMLLTLIFPDPLAGPVPPPAPTPVHVVVSEAGKVSATVAPVTPFGPALLAVIV